MTRSSALVTVFVESRSVITSLRGLTGTDFDPLALPSEACSGLESLPSDLSGLRSIHVHRISFPK